MANPPNKPTYVVLFLLGLNELLTSLSIRTFRRGKGTSLAAVKNAAQKMAVSAVAPLAVVESGDKILPAESKRLMHFCVSSREAVRS